LEHERKQFLDSVVNYEAKLAKLNVDLVEAQVTVGESDRQRETSLQDLKTEVEVLAAQLAAERKNTQERESDFEREIRLYKERFAKELLRLNAQHERELKQKDDQIQRSNRLGRRGMPPGMRMPGKTPSSSTGSGSSYSSAFAKPAPKTESAPISVTSDPAPSSSSSDPVPTTESTPLNDTLSPLSPSVSESTTVSDPAPVSDPVVA